MSQEDVNLAAYEGRPQGWVDVQPISSSETSVYLFRRVWESGAPTMHLTTAEGRYLSPEEVVYAKPCTEMFTRDGDRCVVSQVVIPSDRVFGYVRRSLVTY
ncbi:hypothetical protein DL93DRAFT_2081008 [Clavulina sp. PMI_390]|nr:hypothetical protein DL93DRAFT_2081008 [Clavulina sp. PMI_390]